MSTNDTVIIYGIWIPSKGWLRDDKGNIFGDENKVKCQEVAKLIGQRSKVFFIDDAIQNLEKEYLAQEKRKWHISKIYSILKLK
jgi:hypothetical protein